MWIFCAGSKRSGSTLQYNIIARIVELSNSGIRVPYYKIEDYKKMKDDYSGYEGYKVCKTHSLTVEIRKEIEKNNAIVFHSYRDIRDVVVSYINKGWINIDLKNIEIVVTDYLKEFNLWKENTDSIYSRKYEDFSFNVKNEIFRLEKYLKISLSEEEVNRIEEEVNIKKVKKTQNSIDKLNQDTAFNQTFNKNTLVHTNHINNGSHLQFLNRLSSSEIIAIESIAWKWLIDNGYKLYWNNGNIFLSFSQHADDYIAWQLLRKKRDGVIIEVGAFDGIHLSNSYSLEQLGWKSICIEPNPTIYDYLIRFRPSSKNINAAIVGTEEINDIEFFVEEIGVLSGCSFDEQDIKRRYQNRGLKYNKPKKIIVQAKTLDAIVKELEISSGEIDIVSIDVEGYELEVLKGFDFDAYKVKLFIIEANDIRQKEAILDLFKNFKEYLHIGDNCQNLFLMRKNLISKRVIRKLDFRNYVRAKQHHPTDNSLALDSIPPNFKKSIDYLKFEKSWRLF